MDWRRRCLDAVARRQLPVFPGDLIVFTVTGNRLLVVYAREQGASKDNRPLYGTAPSMGQDVVGLMSEPANRLSHLTSIWIDWSGYAELWTISRGAVG